MDVVMEKLYEIKREPIIHIGRKSVILLRAYIDGYIDRVMEMNSKFHSAYFGFFGFVNKTYHMAPNFSWDRILNAYSSTDEAAFDMFFQLLDEYQESLKE